MVEFIALIKSVVPFFKEEYIDVPFENLNIDSMDLITLRVVFEKHIDKDIPGKEWINFETFEDVFKYYISHKL